MSFTPAEIYAEIKKYVPDFKIKYEPDFRQNIAATWSETIDDSMAREHWGWKPEYDLEAMTQLMITELSKNYK
jgi:threonine 3-dehydrogenase